MGGWEGATVCTYYSHWFGSIITERRISKEYGIDRVARIGFSLRNLSNYCHLNLH